ncbi:MAG: ATP-dependent DNA helicase RecG [Bacilli bacterium]|nr:ATP-dependent DNA helicase RecG [Bacilli bacterium]
MELNQLKGIGPKTISYLKKLNIESINDLVSYYPYRYNTYSFDQLKETDETIIVSAMIESAPVVSYIKRNLNKLSFKTMINNSIVNVVIFNRAFLKQSLQISKIVTLIGKYKGNTFTASDIKFDIKSGDIEPVYHLTSGITNKAISKLIKSAIDYGNYIDRIPEEYNTKYNFLGLKESLTKIHFPEKKIDIANARKRLVYEELFEFSFKMNYLDKKNKKSEGIAKNFSNDKIETFIKNLPFTLTKDQLKAVKEINEDLASERKMNRLLLGDVGSGKTIVSTIAIYASFLAGYQSALMAPTEILALQHYFSIKKTLEKYKISVDVITGSLTKKEKEAIYKRVEAGEVDLLIGTHSLLNEKLEFKKLGLVITDEQHRFGVNQRSVLQKKSTSPDILYLSATPIPRTYAMTIYGDLDISMIKTKPSGRKEIITKVKKESEIKDVLLSVLEEIKKGHQVYIVSPLVDQNDELDLTSVNLLKEKYDLAFQGKIRTEIIHGKMKQNEKDAIMNDFKNNKIKILISTTVIEVGIDVPNATTIIIYNAERFGLASLHQLRGRVGRNDLQSYCYLISNKDNARLKVMEESNDGFYISEKDFELRGHGDLFGTRQHGDMCFKIANLKNDYDILVQAKNDSNEYIRDQGYLSNDYYKNIVDNLEIVD